MIIYVKNDQSFIRQKCINKCFQKRNSPRWNLTWGKKDLWLKFRVAKFDVTKISCTEISRGENVKRRNFRRLNLLWRNITWRKFFEASFNVAQNLKFLVASFSELIQHLYGENITSHKIFEYHRRELGLVPKLFFHV